MMTFLLVVAVGLTGAAGVFSCGRADTVLVHTAAPRTLGTCLGDVIGARESAPSLAAPATALFQPAGSTDAQGNPTQPPAPAGAGDSPFGGADFSALVLNIEDRSDGDGAGRVVVFLPESMFGGGPPGERRYSFRSPPPRLPDDGLGDWMRPDPPKVPLPPATFGGLAGLATVAGYGFLRRRRLREY